MFLSTDTSPSTLLIAPTDSPPPSPCLPSKQIEVSCLQGTEQTVTDFHLLPNSVLLVISIGLIAVSGDSL